MITDPSCNRRPAQAFFVKDPKTGIQLFILLILEFVLQLNNKIGLGATGMDCNPSPDPERCFRNRNRKHRKTEKQKIVQNWLPR